MERRPRAFIFGAIAHTHVFDLDNLVAAGDNVIPSQLSVMEGGTGLRLSYLLERAMFGVQACGWIGEDGTSLRDFLKYHGVSTGLIYLSDYPTGNEIVQRTRKGEYSVILEPLASSFIERWYIDSCLYRMRPGDWVVATNQINELSYLIEQAHLRGYPVALYATPFNDCLSDDDIRHSDYLFINEKDAQALLDRAEVQPEITTADHFNWVLSPRDVQHCIDRGKYWDYSVAEYIPDTRRPKEASTIATLERLAKLYPTTTIIVMGFWKAYVARYRSISLYRDDWNPLMTIDSVGPWRDDIFVASFVACLMHKTDSLIDVLDHSVQLETSSAHSKWQDVFTRMLFDWVL